MNNITQKKPGHFPTREQLTRWLVKSGHVKPESVAKLIWGSNVHHDPAVAEAIAERERAMPPLPLASTPAGGKTN